MRVRAVTDNWPPANANASPTCGEPSAEAVQAAIGSLVFQLSRASSMPWEHKRIVGDTRLSPLFFWRENVLPEFIIYNFAVEIADLGRSCKKTVRKHGARSRKRRLPAHPSYP
jgi:hypothetical protein